MTALFATFHGLGWLGLLPAMKFPGVLSRLLSLGIVGGALLCSLVLLVIACMPPRYGANKRLIVELFLIRTAGLLAAAPWCYFQRDLWSWKLNHFAVRSEAFVQAVDDYVATHGKPPREFDALVPDSLKSLPLGIPAFELFVDGFGEWHYECELCSFAGMRDTLILRSKARRGDPNVPFGQLRRQLGECEFIHE